jgi:hypothetical protein
MNSGLNQADVDPEYSHTRQAKEPGAMLNYEWIPEINNQIPIFF